MVSVSEKLPPGRIPVKIELLDDVSGFYLPSGTSAGVAVYSEHLKFLGELRRILLHMFSWQNVISFEEPGDWRQIAQQLSTVGLHGCSTGSA